MLTLPGSIEKVPEGSALSLATASASHGSHTTALEPQSWDTAGH